MNWDEHRLYDRAQQVVRRDAPAALPNAQLDRRVEQVRDRLRDNSECRHQFWDNRAAGQGDVLECEMCARTFGQITQCVGCHVMVCRYCRRNQMR
jgi:hypothetical protein